jgi:hypothetical protein
MFREASFTPMTKSNNGMQRSADTRVVMSHQRGCAPADAGRYAALIAETRVERFGAESREGEKVAHSERAWLSSVVCCAS